MIDLPYSSVIARLFEAIPDIREYYAQRSSELYAEGNPHVVYGSILVDYIDAASKRLEGLQHDASDQQLRQAFDLIEQLSVSSDFETRCLAETSVLEALLGEKDGIRRFAPYMGPETKALARGIAQSWGLNSEPLS
jgi:hypothetical protein